MSWQLQHLEALASTPAVDIAKAEQGCLDLSHFLTQAPTDFLEPLLGSSFGRVYRDYFWSGVAQKNLPVCPPKSVAMT